MKRLLSIVGFVAILAVAGCGSKEATTPSAEPGAGGSATSQPAVPAGPPRTGLQGRVWQVAEVDGAPVVLAKGGRLPTIEFQRVDAVSGNANGFAGCNTFQGGFKAANGSIHLGPFAVTRKACPGMDTVEAAYLGAMARARTFRVGASSLELLDADGKVVLSYTPKKL